MPSPTRDEILAMEAGPELNALVATEVMGFDINKRTKYIAGKRVHPDDWSPSADIADAWEVVEKMDDVMWTFTWLTDSRVWQARFIDILPMPEAEAPTVQLAICRAALLTTIQEKA